MALQHLPPRVLTLVFLPQKRYSVASLYLTPTQDTQPSHLNPIQPPSEPKPLLAKSIPQSPHPPYPLPTRQIHTPPTHYSSPQLPPPPLLNQPHIPSAWTKGTKTVSVNASATVNFSCLHLNPRLICKASNFTSLTPTMYYYYLRLVLGFFFVNAIELGGRGSRRWCGFGGWKRWGGGFIEIPI